MLSLIVFPAMVTLPVGLYVFCIANPSTWQDVLQYFDYQRIGDFAVDGRSFAMFGLDLRATSVTGWMRQWLERTNAGMRDLPEPAAETEVPIFLDGAEFGAAVREALRHWHDPAVLGRSPLLRSRLVRHQIRPSADRNERTAAFRAIVLEAAGTLAQAQRSAAGYQALVRTYFDPAPVQKQAADELGMAFSTYRRHLTAAVTKLIELLWLRDAE
jgi:hypothetical protein